MPARAGNTQVKNTAREHEMPDDYLDGIHEAEDGTPVNFDGRYTVHGRPGIAWRLLGWATEWTQEDWTLNCDPAEHDDDSDEHGSQCWLYDEPEETERRDMVRAVMVGDDRTELVDVCDLTEISEEDYCAGCGQTGCYAERIS
jgi:hypothetical protein